MSIKLTVPAKRELKPRIVVIGVGGAGGNAVNNMIAAGLEGVDFVVANTDAQALTNSKAERRIQMGIEITQGLGAGSDPDIGRQAALEAMPDIIDMLQGAHMVFITAGMGGGTGTGAAAVIANAAREQIIKGARESGILTVGVVTKPFDFEGTRRMRSADAGIEALEREVDTLIVIPNQNLFGIANAQTTFAEAFAMADEVLHSGVASITDLMIHPGLINLDFADVCTVMHEMGKAMMGTGEAEGESRAREAAEVAIANPLLDINSMRGARGVLINITGGLDVTLHEVEEAATIIKNEVDAEANIIIGTALDENLEGVMRVSVVATGIGDEGRAETGEENKVISMSGLADDSFLQHLPQEPQSSGDSGSLAGSLDMSANTSGLDIPSLTAPVVSAPIPAPAPITPTEQSKTAGNDELPNFLRERAVVPPRRELSKRSRSFMERVFGTKPETPQEAGQDSVRVEVEPDLTPEMETEMSPAPQNADAVASAMSAPRISASSAATMEAPAPVAKVETPAPVAKVEAPAPVAKVETPAPVAKVETPAPVAKVETPAPAAKVETPAPAAKVEAPAPVAKVETPAPAAKVEAPAMGGGTATGTGASMATSSASVSVSAPASSPASIPAPASVPSAPAVGLSGQTSMETSSAQDMQQLDIPAFLRR